MHPALNLDDATIEHFCKSHHIRRLALFGSQLKGTARPESDIDVLVGFEPTHMWESATVEIAGILPQLQALLANK